MPHFAPVCRSEVMRNVLLSRISDRIEGVAIMISKAAIRPALSFRGIRICEITATMLVENLMRTGHRVGGFGLQYHMFERDLDAMLANYPATMLNQEHLVDCLDTHASLGVPLNISEITVTAREDLGNDNLAFQAYAIERLYRLWFSHPAVNGIIYWNLVDDTAYSPAGSLWNENFFKGGLVTRAFKPKPAYQAVRNLVRDEWTTRETVTFDPQKPCYLRGFYGTYEVRIKLPGGRVETTTARLVKDRKNRFAFTV